jgi:c-di-GMP-related signal transduction protein
VYRIQKRSGSFKKMDEVNASRQYKQMKQEARRIFQGFMLSLRVVRLEVKEIRAARKFLEWELKRFEEYRERWSRMQRWKRVHASPGYQSFRDARRRQTRLNGWNQG